MDKKLYNFDGGRLKECSKDDISKIESKYSHFSNVDYTAYTLYKVYIGSVIKLKNCTFNKK